MAGNDLKIELRNLKTNDYEQLKSSMIEAYIGLENAFWKKESIDTLLELFPDGQLCVLVNDKVVGAALSIVVDYKKYGDNHTYAQITDKFTFGSHDPDGDVLYGIDVFVHPEYRGMRLGRRLYDARKELCEALNLRAIIFGGRIPNYEKYSDKLKPRQYIEKVKEKEIHDPVLNFQLANDFHVKKVLTNYLSGDTQSKEYATLLQWDNIYYDKEDLLIKTKRTYIRIGLVQWQMRMFKNFDALVEQVEYFVDAVSDYKSDFILFPELFNAPLMAEFNHLGEAKAIRGLAKYTEPLLDKFREFSVSYNVNIITGSMPYLEGNDLYNCTYLCRRDGSYDIYKKIHITPSERRDWAMSGGDSIKVFDTDCGKIGVLICYDVEFPELARIYAQEGMKILFVPFLTDTQNGYNRVRRCAQARAVENECYVAIAGCIGNLPKISNMDLCYAQSAVFTPSDFPFPNNAIKAEATPNTEMIVVADIDVELLKDLHEFGSVQTLKDRRTDLYEVVYKKKK
ncbi:MAG: bifunctional GNAT family N-acetyltransferase/carbon-nitrogen hydrolase family protein [Saprospiraceae bacterium]